MVFDRPEKYRPEIIISKYIISELREVYAELAEKTPDTLQLIRDRHKKPKPQVSHRHPALAQSLQLPFGLRLVSLAGATSKIHACMSIGEKSYMSIVHCSQ